MTKNRLEAFSDGVIAVISPVLYIAAIVLSFVNQWIADGIYIFVALMWLVPDRRIESALNDR